MSWGVWLSDLRLCGATLSHCGPAIWSVKLKSNLSTSQFAWFFLFCFVLFELLSFLFLMIDCSKGGCFRDSLILHRRRSNLVHFSLEFSVDDRWKPLAERLRKDHDTFEFYKNEKRQQTVLRVLQWWGLEKNGTVGELYDILVDLDLANLANYL